MEVLQLTATQFIKPMSTGRNRPLLLGCENAGGDTFEVVVKFRGREMDEKAQVAELVTAQLADDLGLHVPQAAVVDVPVGFEMIIAEKELAVMVKGSAGLNFGSVHLGAGFTTWPPGREPYGAQRDQAADVFVFDTLIQNADRRAVNPNLWARSDRLGIYDHELAFRFLAVPIIGGAPKPWAVANHGKAFGFLDHHIFYRSLRGGRLDLGPFKEALGAMTDEQIQTYADSIPAAWRNQSDFCDRIMEYLREAREQRESLIQFIKHLLR
ncbi:MAG: hypothetical protein HY298_27270 [Verrucomicrobia bacterium]|nr:hypothetical protein [Verrucomicrobiota bacterium]